MPKKKKKSKGEPADHANAMTPEMMAMMQQGMYAGQGGMPPMGIPPGMPPQGMPPGMMHPGMMQPGMHGMPPGMQGMPPGMQGMPPGMQGMPPGMQGMPPGMQGMPPGMQGMPPGMQGMPPGMQGMPPGMQGMPPGMQGMPPGMQGMPPGMQGMPPGMQGMPPGMQGMPPGMQGMPPGMQGMPPQMDMYGGYGGMEQQQQPPADTGGAEAAAREKADRDAGLHISIDQLTIKFDPPNGSVQSRRITAKNLSDTRRVAFKLQTNKPEMYLVTPSKGVMISGKTEVIEVEMKAEVTVGDINKDKNNHKFNILTMPWPDSKKQFDQALWDKDRKSDALKTATIKVEPCV